MVLRLLASPGVTSKFAIQHLQAVQGFQHFPGKSFFRVFDGTACLVPTCLGTNQILPHRTCLLPALGSVLTPLSLRHGFAQGQTRLAGCCS